MALNSLFQLLVARETDAGTVASGLVASGNAGNLVIEPSLTYEPESFERNIARGTLSASTPIAGAIPATCTFQMELAGVSSGTPAWAVLLEACGFRRFANCSAYSGAFDVTNTAHTVEHIVTNDIFTTGNDTHRSVIDTYSGETGYLFETAAITTMTGSGSISGSDLTVGTRTTNACDAYVSTSQEVISFAVDTNGTDAIAVGDIWLGTGGTVIESLEALAVSQSNTQIRFRVLSGGAVSASEAFTDVATSATFSANSTPAKTLADVPTVSLALIEDGRMKVMRGARGNVTFSVGNIGEPVILTFTFQGAYSSISDRGAFTGVTFNALTPPVCLGAIVEVGSDNASFDAPADYITPCVASFTVDAGNQLALRRCMDDSSGILNAAITERNGTFTFDPEIAPEAFFPFLDNMISSNGFRFNLEWGTNADANGFRLYMPDCQITAESVGDRDGVAVDEYTSSLGARLPEANGDGSDREITLLHFLQ